MLMFSSGGSLVLRWLQAADKRFARGIRDEHLAEEVFWIRCFLVYKELLNVMIL